MAKKREPKPKITPKYLLDRIDFQLSTASVGIKRLKISLDPACEDFRIDPLEELRELDYRFRVLNRRLHELKTLPKAAWRI